MAALVQHITLQEFLPLVLGKAGLQEHGLTPFSQVETGAMSYSFLTGRNRSYVLFLSHR